MSDFEHIDFEEIEKESWDKYSKYEIDGEFGTHCEHDELTVWGVDVGAISSEDVVRLDELGFFVSDEYGEECLKSFTWGSC